MAYENFQEWLAEYQGVRFEIEPDRAHVDKMLDTGSMDPTKRPMNVEALARLRPDVDRGAYFGAMGRYVHGRDEQGMDNALQFNLEAFRQAVAAQLAAPKNIKLSTNVEMAGVVLPGFVEGVKEILDELSPADRAKVVGMGIEYTPRDLDLLRHDEEDIDPAKVTPHTGRYLGAYINTTKELADLGFRNIVDDLVIKPGRTDPRTLSPYIHAAKIDTLSMKPKKNPETDAFYTPQERDALSLDDRALETTQDGIDALAARPGGLIPVTFEGVGSATNLNQVRELAQSNDGLDYAIQGFVFAQPNDDLLALVGSKIERPHLRRGYVANKAQASTRAGGNRDVNRFTVIGLGAAAVAGFFSYIGDQLGGPRTTDPVVDNSVAPLADAADAGVATQRGLSVIDVDNGDFDDGFMTIRGTRIDFVGGDRSLDIANPEGLPEDVLGVATTYAEGLNTRGLFETSAQADARMRTEQEARDAAEIRAAVDLGRPIRLERQPNTPAGPGFGGSKR